MKTFLKTVTICIFFMIIASCKKDTPTPATTSASTSTNYYASASSFLAANRSPMQTYTVSGTTGGSFTTPNGTIVWIPANAFMDQNGDTITGNVTISFKDIYHKSEMVLNDISTNMFQGGPIKSAGMFYIKATQGAQALQLQWGQSITITQPLNGEPIDTLMEALVMEQGNNISPTGWLPPDTMFYDALSAADTALNYVFSLYQFNYPLDSGSWCNSDNPNYFSAYIQTNITIQPQDDPSIFHPSVFLIFKNVNSMVHVYWNSSSLNFPYNYAPEGLQCTLVAIGTKDGTLYSCFKPISISQNMSINFSLSATTSAAFKTQLNALN